MASDNPYQTLIGADWARLSERVRLSHQVPLIATGHLQIFRAAQGLAGFVSRRLKFPPTGDRVPVRVMVERTPRGILWARTFGSQRMDTLHTFGPSGVLERAGPLAILFAMHADGDSIVLQQKGLRVFGIPLPLWLGPKVSGKVSPGADDRSWHVDILVRHDRLGDICRYHGMMRAE